MLATMINGYGTAAMLEKVGVKRDFKAPLKMEQVASHISAAAPCAS
jgi:uridylate kinase